MAGVNKVILLGNLGNAPEISAGRDNIPIARFSVATSLDWKDEHGQKKSRAEWHKCVAFRRLAEICHTYLGKGSKVYIEGHLNTSSWEDEFKNKRSRTEIIVDEMQMLDGRPSSESTAHTNAATNTEKNFNDFDDDIPF